jgi:hypothetical protein
MRRAGIVVGVVMLVLVGTGIESAGAAKPPVAVNAEIRCFWTKGKVTMSPPFVNGGTTPAVVDFRGNLRCESDDVDVPTLPQGIRGASVIGSFTVPTNACNNTGFSQIAGPGEATFKWKGKGKIVPTEMTTDDVEYEIGTGTAFGFPDYSLNPHADTTGSFAGGADFGGYADVLDAASRCGPKTKGVRGSGTGIKKAKICGEPDGCYALAFIN